MQESQLTSKNDENENLQARIRELESDNNILRSESFQILNDAANKIRDLSNENEKLRNSIDQNMICKGPIVGNNGLALLKNQSEIEVCQDYGIYDEPENSLLMFYYKAKDGTNEGAVITRGLSSHLNMTSNVFKIGNQDKIITSFNTNKNFEYSIQGTCGVIYQGLIHFFGGSWDRKHQNQHFGFDEKRNFVQYKNLAIDLKFRQCTTFMISKSNSQCAPKEVVLLCFDYNQKRTCHQYDDGELTHFADTKDDHWLASLGKYKDLLITVGDSDDNQKTEILHGPFNKGEYGWTFGRNYKFSQTGVIYAYSMVNIPQMGYNEEYLLLIGGKHSTDNYSDKIYKYNGNWRFFGKLQKTRAYHESVLLNGRVITIGGKENNDNQWIKTETWDMSKSKFETESTWPELNNWVSDSNYVFIIPDYINPL